MCCFVVWLLDLHGLETDAVRPFFEVRVEKHEPHRVEIYRGTYIFMLAYT